MIVAYELILLTKSRKRFLYSECCTVQGLYFQFVYLHLNIALREKNNNNNNKKKHVDLPQWSSWTKKTAESSQLNKSVMFVRKLNCLQKRRHFYAFFEPLKREASVEGQNAQRGGVLACFALEFARLKEIGKKDNEFFAGWYLRPTCVAGADRGGKRRGEGALVNSFQLVFSLVCACHAG